MKMIESENKTVRPDGAKVKHVILMASLMQDAEDQAKELQPARRQRSFHYVIGCDGNMVQCVPEDFRAWSVQKRSIEENAISVLFCTKGIPNCSVMPETWKALVELVADLCRRYNLEPFTTVKRDGSIIPYFVGADMNRNFATFLSDVAKKLHEDKPKRKRKGASV